MILKYRSYNPSMRDFGKRLRLTRIEKGLNQNDLARIADLHPMQVSKYERGERSPSADNLLALCKALGVTADYLLTGNGENKDAEAGEIFRYPMLIERAREIDRELGKKDIEAVLSFLDAFIAKKRIQRMMTA